MTEKKMNGVVLASILIAGFCLRPSITGIGSLLRLIKADMGLSSAAAGLLTTIPMISFALISPLAGRLNARLGTFAAIFTGFALIIAGCAVRSYAGAGGLFSGTLVIGAGIAIGNVLLPGVIKSEFPARFGTVLAYNTTLMAVSSGVSSGVNYPLAAGLGLGWRHTLFLWAVPAVIAILAWYPSRKVQVAARRAEGRRTLLGSALAWWVTLFMGIVALVFYSCISWLASIFQSKGLDAAAAGYYVSAFQLMGIPSSFIVPFLAGRRKDQRKLSYGLLAVFLAGIAAMALTSTRAGLLVAALLSGFAGNGAFALAMAFIGFRSSNGDDAVRLSAMSQSVGYVIAAAGPALMGLVFDRWGNWNVNLWIVAVLVGLLILVSGKCAREGTV